MRGVTLAACCIVGLSIPLMAQTHRLLARPEPPAEARNGQPLVQRRLYQQTWYDAMLRQFNPENLDWGQWLEQRRQDFLEQTAANPYFKYGMVTTLLLLLLTIALTKALIDKSRVKWLAEERHEDLLRHDAYSRQAAREAIARYNRHIEKCNRVVEAELAGRREPQGLSAAATVDTKPEERLLNLADTERERAALEAKLEKTNAVVADLTLRMNQVKPRGGGHGAPDGQDSAAGAGMAELVRMVSELQQQLYQERERNKRLKGL